MQYLITREAWPLGTRQEEDTAQTLCNQGLHLLWPPEGSSSVLEVDGVTESHCRWFLEGIGSRAFWLFLCSMLCTGGFWHEEVPSLPPALAFPPALLWWAGWLCLQLKADSVAKVGSYHIACLQSVAWLWWIMSSPWSHIWLDLQEKYVCSGPQLIF